jgi:hypothetical protein
VEEGSSPGNKVLDSKAQVCDDDGMTNPTETARLAARLRGQHSAGIITEDELYAGFAALGLCGCPTNRPCDGLPGPICPNLNDIPKEV